MLRRNPGFTAPVLLTIALGVGGTAAVFSVVDGVLLRPLPYAEADRIVTVADEHPGSTSPFSGVFFSNLDVSFVGIALALSVFVGESARSARQRVSHDAARSG
jgi:hypothetical protein